MSEPRVRQRPLLQGSRINLRELRAPDSDSIFRYVSDRSVARWLPDLPKPYTMEQARRWVALTKAMAEAGTDYHFGIEHGTTGEIVGMIGLNRMNWEDRNAEVGYWVARRYWRQGFAREALQLLLPFSFRTLRLRRIFAIVLAPNEGSYRLLEEEGFKREVVRRQERRFRGRWVDVYMYGMLHEEFAAAVKGGRLEVGR